MKFEKPTEEMKEVFYKNYKWSVRGNLLLHIIFAITATAMFILTLIVFGKIPILYIIFTGVFAFMFLSSVVCVLLTIKKMKTGDFMVAKVFFKGFHKKLHSPLEMEFEYENEEGSRITKKYQVDMFKGRRPPVAGEEIVITIMPDQVIYFVE